MSPCPFDPLASTAPLIVYIDYKSPYAYLAKDPTYAIADELGVEIDWRPFTLDIPSYLGSARLDSEGRVVESKRSTSQWAMVKYAYRDARPLTREFSESRPTLSAARYSSDASICRASDGSSRGGAALRPT